MAGWAASRTPEGSKLDPVRFQDAVLELIRRTATELPEDVKEALRRARAREEPGSRGELAMSLILRNMELAEGRGVPACQDTGTPLFYVHHPEGLSTRAMRQAIEAALREATRRQYLRPNAVDPVTGRNSGVNVGAGFPPIHYLEWDEPRIQVDLMLKGGGCENVGAQYSLPYAPLQAGRDLDGVRKVVLDAVVRAEGKGCPPGVLGVCIGGDRSSGYEASKRQLLRPLDDRNPDPVLAELETRILEEANQLEIGPLGFGGNTTLLGVKVGALHRLPASYFVTISYMCWECRRRTLILQDGAPPVIR